jgi:glycosyltransferase involved in cell wall biosynthesis
MKDECGRLYNGRMAKICIVPSVDGIGGMASFRLKFEQGLRARGVDVTHDLSAAADATLVIAGTRSLIPLWRAGQRRQRIVQRLDGINWVHRKRKTGIKHFLRAEYGNFILSFIRRNIATKIIYQSEFSHNWWEERYGKTRVPSAVIHNGIDLNMYSPADRADNPIYRLLIVEGSLGGGYDMGLDNAIELAETLKEKYDLPIELMVVGKISDEHRVRVETKSRAIIQWMGSVPRERIPEIMRSAHLLFSADLHPACPNAVIEALACGLPVVGFDTGAVKELVIGDAGRVVPYGSNSWNIEPPDVPALAQAAYDILKDQSNFSRSARSHAESALGLDQMVEAYLKVLLED